MHIFQINRFLLFAYICTIHLAASAKTPDLPSGFPYSVKVTLSAAAEKKMNDSKETILVNSFFSGVPLPNVKVPAEIQDFGEVYLGKEIVELKQAGSVTFKGNGLVHESLQYINHEDINLLINVWSGRKASTDNLLDCGIFSGKLKSVEDSTIEISCKLIRE